MPSFPATHSNCCSPPAPQCNRHLQPTSPPDNTFAAARLASASTLEADPQPTCPRRTRSAAHTQPLSSTNAIAVFEQATVSASTSHCCHRISTSKPHCRRSNIQPPWKLQQPPSHLSRKHPPSTA